MNNDVRCEVTAETEVLARIAGSEALMDALSCVLLAAGSAAALLAPTVLDAGAPSHLATASVIVAALFWAGRRWWMIPALCIVAVLCVSMYLGAARSPTDMFFYWQSFAGWLASGARGYADAAFLTTARWLVTFVISLVAVVLVRSFFVFPVLVGLQAGVCCFSGWMADTDLSAAVCLGAAGLIIQMPRMYAARLAAMYAASGKSGDGPPLEAGISRARMQAVAVIAAAFSVCLSLWLVPQDTTQAWKSYSLNVWVDDMRTVLGSPFREWPAMYSVFDLGGLGFSHAPDRMGGPAILTDETHLSARANRAVLLKGRVLDHYDGARWLASRPDGDLRYASPLWGRVRKETYDLTKPEGGAQAARLYEQLTSDISIRIIHEHAGFNALFAPENLRGVAFTTPFTAHPEAYFNRRSELYMRRYLPKAAAYTVSARVWDTGAHWFDERFTMLEGLTRGEKSYPLIAERYTQLYEALPERVRRLAEDITDTVGSPYLKATAIGRWLAQNCAYTLEPDMPPEGVDFVAHFLDTREGHCVYYATAMTVLARCAGLPARYVQGFALRAVEGGLYQATGQTAHAWAEIYFEGIGWMPFDALRWAADAPLNSGAAISDQDEAEPRAPERARMTTDTDGATDDAPGGKTAASRYVLLLLVLLLPVALYRWALYAAPKYKARQWTVEAVRRRTCGNDDALDAVYRDILRLLSLHGITVRPAETLVTFPERVDRRIRLAGYALAETAGAIMRARFGGVAPTDDEIVCACRYHSALEAETFAHLGRGGYLLKRVLFAARGAQM